MSETANAIVMRVTHNALKDAGIAGGRVHPFRANPEQPKPYVIMMPVASAPNNWSSRRDFSVDLNIRVVSDKMSEAIETADAVRLALNDRGVNDRYTAVDSGTAWKILSISEGTQFSLIEPIENASPLYLEGAIYTFNLEEYDARICGE